MLNMEPSTAREAVPAGGPGKLAILIGTALLAGFGIWFLVTQVSLGSDSPLALGEWVKGRALIVRVQKINSVEEVRYLGLDGNHYLVAPTNPDNLFWVLQLSVHNAEANRVILTMDEGAAQLRGTISGERFDLLDITPANETNVSIVPNAHSAEDRYSPFITSEIALDQGFQITGWLAFEVPRTTKIKEMRWGAGDIIFLK
jgi:hypothetical protein